ncbi:MAG: hypothetical protein ACOY3Y_20870 [Acidobacteriota bacterium]
MEGAGDKTGGWISSGELNGGYFMQMEPSVVIANLRAELLRLKAQGETTISLDALDRELHAIQELAGSNPDDFKLVMKERLSIAGERSRHQLDHRSREITKLLEATTHDAASSIRILLALNGGGAIALLALLGHLVSDPGLRTFAPGVAASLLLFGVGLAFTAGAGGCAYCTNLNFYRGKTARGQGWRRLAVISASGALLAFVVAVFVAYGVLAG